MAVAHMLIHYLLLTQTLPKQKSNVFSNTCYFFLSIHRYMVYVFIYIQSINNISSLFTSNLLCISLAVLLMSIPPFLKVNETLYWIREGHIFLSLELIKTFQNSCKHSSVVSEWFLQIIKAKCICPVWPLYLS